MGVEHTRWIDILPFANQLLFWLVLLKLVLFFLFLSLRFLSPTVFFIQLLCHQSINFVFSPFLFAIRKPLKSLEIRWFTLSFFFFSPFATFYLGFSSLFQKGKELFFFIYVIIFASTRSWSLFTAQKNTHTHTHKTYCGQGRATRAPCHHRRCAADA